MSFSENIKLLGSIKSGNKWAERICSEIFYLDRLSSFDTDFGEKEKKCLENAVENLVEKIKEDGTVTKLSALETETALAPLVGIAKSYDEIFISHAHIDMNWMWGYNETVAVTIDTFRTILTLMREYPEFTFAQSQASTYEIIEKYCPEMLPEIRERIHEGRWEVTAVEWVEPDKNMPDGESLTRHIIQTRKYLSELLEISPDSLDLDFVPDTFGHNINVPEILASAGIKYMYHCRGGNVPNLYNFVSPSGKRTLNYCEFDWYNGTITTDKFEMLPTFCRDNKIKSFLVCYGVGDHGGGPTRRDIERIAEYKTWPLTPSIRFGTFRDFFHSVEKIRDSIPTVDSELNCVFTGCYTTQTRIKMSNRISEARINDAETMNALSSLLEAGSQPASYLDKAWRNILFNHFHDILPGSGTVETREYAMGRFQDSMAYISAAASKSMKDISSVISTKEIPFDNDNETISEGGGVGYHVNETDGFKFPSAERGRGKTRAFHLFNTSAFERDEVCDITVWDYNYDIGNIEVTDHEGNSLAYGISPRQSGYWGHNFNTLSVKTKVPAFGYTTVIMKQKPVNGHVPFSKFNEPRTDNFINDDNIVLENECIKAAFDHKTLELVLLFDKKSNEQLISEKSCYFRLVHENDLYGMTAWRVGPTMSEINLNETNDVRITRMFADGVHSELGYRMSFGSSQIDAEITLRSGDPYFRVRFTVDWHEKAEHGRFVPQLNFVVPVSYATDGKSVCDIPYGIIERGEISHDVPCLSYISVSGETDHIVSLLSDCKYGYRLTEKTASVTLIRSSYDPDPYPEYGVHTVTLAVCSSKKGSVPFISRRFNHPILFIPATEHEGILPLCGSALNVSGNVIVSSVKKAERGNGIALRVYSIQPRGETCRITMRNDIGKAYLADSDEKIICPLPTEGNTVTLAVDAFATSTIIIEE